MEEEVKTMVKQFRDDAQKLFDFGFRKRVLAERIGMSKFLFSRLVNGRWTPITLRSIKKVAQGSERLRALRSLTEKIKEEATNE